MFLFLVRTAATQSLQKNLGASIACENFKNHLPLLSGDAGSLQQTTCLIPIKIFNFGQPNSFKMLSSPTPSLTKITRLNPCICMMFLTDLQSVFEHISASRKSGFLMNRSSVLMDCTQVFLIPTASFPMSLEDSHLEVPGVTLRSRMPASFAAGKKGEVVVCCMISATNRSYSPVSLT